MDTRNHTHYRMTHGRRGLTSSNGGRSTESATSATLTRAAFLERSSLALQSPAQRADPSLQATPTADVAQEPSDVFSPALPPTPFVVGAPLSQTAIHYYNLDGYTPDGSWPCQSCLRYTNGGFEVNTTFVSTTPSFSITARDPAHYCYDRQPDVHRRRRFSKGRCFQEEYE